MASRLGLDPWSFMALALGTSAAVGWLVYRLVETPMLAWLQAKRTAIGLAARNVRA